MASDFNVVPLDVCLEIRELEVKVGEERKLLSNLKLIEDLGRCVHTLEVGKNNF